MSGKATQTYSDSQVPQRRHGTAYARTKREPSVESVIFEILPGEGELCSNRPVQCKMLATEHS